MQRLIATRLAVFGQASLDQISTSLPSLATHGMHTSITLLQSGATGVKGGQAKDPFTQQLQEKMERELADLVAARENAAADSESDDEKPELPPARDDEIGGPKGKEPTRYGDWEKGGRCTDF
jgi:hypothetical protein